MVHPEIDLVPFKDLATQITDMSATRGQAEFAIDGDADSIFSRGSCTHTSKDGETDPWWSVPLPDRYLISEIDIYNRLARPLVIYNLKTRIFMVLFVQNTLIYFRFLLFAHFVFAT